MVMKLKDDVAGQPLLNLDQPEVHSEGFVASQSAKLHLALGPDSPGLDVISSRMSVGNAEDYKALLADRDRLNRTRAQADVMSSIMETDPSMITPEILEVARGLSMAEMQSEDLSSIVEKKYAEVYTNTAAARMENEILDDAMAENPEAAMEVLSRAEVAAFKSNYAQTALDSVAKEAEDRSFFSKVWDFSERIVPFVEWYQKHGQIESDFVSSILPGSNLVEQYAYLWGLSDPTEFQTTFDTVVADLRSRNLDVAQSWIEGFFSYGNSDQAFDNLFAIADVAGLAPVKTLAGAMKGVIRGAVKNPTRLQSVTAEIGKNAEAATAQVVGDIQVGSLFGDIPKAKDLENSIPSIAQPDKLLSGSQNVPQAAYLRLKDSLYQRADLARRFLTDVNQVDRLSPEELLKYKDILLREYTQINPNISKNIIDVSIDDAADLGNVYNAKIIFGKRDGTLFESEKQARLYFSRHIGGSDFTVEQVGEGFRVVVKKAVDETKLGEISLETLQQTPENIASTFGGLVRSADYLVSNQNVLARSVVTTSTERLNILMTEMAQPLNALSKKEWAELEDIMVTNRQKIQYHENYGQFEDAFFDRFKKLPTEKQADAYFTYVQINDLDLTVRDLDWYKQKARLGLQDITLKIDGEDVPFEGKIVESLPAGSSDYFSVSVVDGGKAGKAVPSRFLSEKHFEQFRKLKDQGYKIIQVADQGLKLGEQYVGFVITKDFKAKRVGVKNVDRKAGGHKVYKYPYYIKQGKITGDGEVRRYRGDTSFFNFRSEKEAREFLPVLEQARQMILRKDPKATQFIRDNLPIPVKEFMADIKQGKIDLTVPFAVTRRGSRTIDTGAYSGMKDVVDASKNEHNLSGQITGRYAGERSEVDLATIQSEAGVRFESAGAQLLSPMESLKISVGDMISVRGMNDYTVMTNENFWREFGDILDTTEAEFRASGTSFLENPVFRRGADQFRQLQAKNVSRAFRQLQNRPTVVDRALEAFKEKTLSSVMPKFGPRGQQWLEKKMLNRAKSPGQYLRSAAFDFKLGMFNVQQLFVQANSAVNIAAIAGMDGLRSLSVYPMARAALWTNRRDIIEGIGDSVAKTGLMTKDEFVEALDSYKKSGFNDIGGDMAYLDDVSTPEMRKGKMKQGLGTFLKWGRTPFQEGERAVRLAAYMTAYVERKKLVPRMTRRDEAAILLRAKNLTGNMTRESNTAWQKGYAAVFTQFFGYQARIMEQMLGKKLTSAERIRLFTGYSAVYGVPTALGASAGFLPMREIAMEYLMGQGVDVNDPALEPFLDGFVSAGYEYVMGNDKELSIAGRYGPGGIPTFYDLWRGDKTVSETFLGASGSIIGQTYLDAVPFLKGMWSEFMDGEGGYHNLTKDDFLAPLRNITTVDSAAKLYNVWNFGVWASKNEANIIEMDLPDAVMAVLTGLQPAEIEDAFTAQRATENFKERIKSLQKDFVKEYRQAMKMEDGKTRDKIIRDIKARMILEGFSLKEMRQTWERAADQEMITDVFFEQYEKSVLRRKGMNGDL
ncbi:MAG: hypothetical protein AB7W16_15595 [Candidatus Obscuribacterales bacterium]